MPKSGTAVQLYDANGTYAQKWIAIEEEAGIRLVSALDENLVLDVVNGKSAQGTRLRYGQTMVHRLRDGRFEP